MFPPLSNNMGTIVQMFMRLRGNAKWHNYIEQLQNPWGNCRQTDGFINSVVLTNKIQTGSKYKQPCLKSTTLIATYTVLLPCLIRQMTF